MTWLSDIASNFVIDMINLVKDNKSVFAEERRSGYIHWSLNSAVSVIVINSLVTQ